MKKVIAFSLFLMLGLVASQILPTQMGGEQYINMKDYIANPLLYTCLAFIMINVGREFEINKKEWRSYSADYFIAMATAALPWLLIALYYVFVLLPDTLWSSGDAWKESLLLSRFAAPTSAGILFTMLAAMSLSKSWIYKKIQVLAIFDDLDTILLMIPLQIMMIGLKWQMGAVLAVVLLLLYVGWKWLNRFSIPQNWISILLYSLVIYGITHVIYVSSKYAFGADGSIHIEVLLPAFVMGMIIKSKHSDDPTEERVANVISYLFMFLVGVSMPLVIGSGALSSESSSVIASVPQMGWGEIAVHVFLVSLLSNVGKLVPLFFYRDRKVSERLAVSIGMFTRGEVGAGVIFIAIGYNLGGNALIISALTLVLNLILTGGFVLLVRNLALRSYDPQMESAEA
ncbi:MAG: sodium:proton antiporter [Rikenellaceae bacterium]